MSLLKRAAVVSTPCSSTLNSWSGCPSTMSNLNGGPFISVSASVTSNCSTVYPGLLSSCNAVANPFQFGKIVHRFVFCRWRIQKGDTKETDLFCRVWLERGGLKILCLGLLLLTCFSVHRSTKTPKTNALVHYLRGSLENLHFASFRAVLQIREMWAHVSSAGLQHLPNAKLWDKNTFFCEKRMHGTKWTQTWATMSSWKSNVIVRSTEALQLKAEQKRAFRPNLWIECQCFSVQWQWWKKELVWVSNTNVNWLTHNKSFLRVLLKMW